MKWVSRAEWGARPPKGTVYTVPASERTAFVSHYDGGARINLPDHSGCAAQVRKAQAYHMDVNGWSDIGYNTLGCPHGYVFEGRGLDKVGAHCPDFNRVGHGHQFMLGGDQEPTQAALNAAREVYDLQSKRSGNALRKMGHRDGFATACPGENVYEWVEAGMPATKATQTKEWDEMASLEEVQKAILWADVIPSKNILGDANPTVTTITALRWACEWSLAGRNAAQAAARDAAASLSIVKAMAAKGSALTAEEIEEAAKRGVTEALAEGIELTVKAGE